MNDLEKERLNIERIDSSLSALFEERMAAVRKIACYKKENGLPVFNAQREDALFLKSKECFKDPEMFSYFEDVYKSVLNASKRFQHDLLFGEEDLSVHLGARTCSVYFGRDSILKAGEYFDLNRNILIVTDSGVPSAYANAVLNQCKNGHIFCAAQGEGAKTLQICEQILSEMLRLQFTRYDAVIAVGGGMVSDLAGFAAASYMRGIDYYIIPTTLLAQVDACIGGKTAVNLSGVKNTVGAFYQPKAVIIDPQLLKTLPDVQIRNGLAEALKMALTCDASLFSLFENEDPLSHLNEIIIRSIKIKKTIVELDETENGMRRVLNFGHTIGHAIESTQNGTGLCHGECVAIGMLPMLSPALRERVLKIYRKIGLPVSLCFASESVLSALRHDKKSVGDSINCIFVETPGSYTEKSVPADAFPTLLKTVYSG